MNPWDMIGTGFGWFFLMVLIVLFAGVLVVSIASLGDLVQKQFSQKMSSETYFREANRTAMEKYVTLGEEVGVDKIDAFNTGALWGWKALHDKK